MSAYQDLVNVINKEAVSFRKGPSAYAELIDKIGDARFVLLGEATHGTHEFYQARIDITQELIAKKGFMAVMIEGDFQDVFAINSFLQNNESLKNWDDALNQFNRFPKWLWRNQTMLAFFSWLREFNQNQVYAKQIKLYGMDLYNPHKSMQVVLSYLKKIDPDAADRALLRYRYLELSDDPHNYGYLVSVGKKRSCVREVIEQVLELQHRAALYVDNADEGSKEQYFLAMQNARVVKSAEHYYRALFESRVSSWNKRDEHMVSSFNALAEYLEEKYQRPAKIIVWAHNSHLGDARATEMGERGEINVGQLLKEQYGKAVYSIGFSTYSGTVTAAQEWGEAPECMEINPALPSSYEHLFHDLSYPNFWLDLKSTKIIDPLLAFPRLQRAIGVVYKPETERHSHYYYSRLPYQFDMMIHFDETHAVIPLEINLSFEHYGASETYPTGI